MIAGEMDSYAFCRECDAIAEELHAAYGDAWTSGDQAFKDAWVATYKMIGGTEEDAARAEELIPKARPQDPSRINLALNRMFAHQARSGHKIRRATNR